MAQQGGDIVKAINRNKGGLLAQRFRPQTKHRLRDYAKGPLAADEQLLEVVAGVVLKNFMQRREYCAIGQHRFQPEHHIAHHAVTDHPVAAGVGRQIAANGRRTAGAEIERQHHAGLGRRLLGGLQGDSGFDGHGRGVPVNLDNPGHPFHRQGDFLFIGHTALDQAGHAALRHHRLAGGMANF